MALSVVCPFGRLATVHTDGASPMRFVMADGRWPIVNSCVFTAVDRKLFLRITFFGGVTFELHHGTVPTVLAV